MSDQMTIGQLEDLSARRKRFEQIKLRGRQLVDEGVIDEKTFQQKNLEIGRDLGLFGPTEVPTRNAWVRGVPAIGGGVIGGLAGLAGGPAGGAVGAGVGGALGELIGSKLEDVLYPDAPKPLPEQVARDMALTGAAETVGTAVLGKMARGVGGAGSGATGLARNVTERGRRMMEGASKKVRPPGQQQVSEMIGKAVGVTDEGAETAARLADDFGVEMSLGQASANPFATAAYGFTSRLPFFGQPGIRQVQQSYDQIDRALNQITALPQRLPAENIPPGAVRGTGTARPVPQSQRSQQLLSDILPNLEARRKQYQNLYRQADAMTKEQGNFFDVSALTAVADNALRRVPGGLNVAEKLLPGKVRKILQTLKTQPDTQVSTGLFMPQSSRTVMGAAEAATPITRKQTTDIPRQSIEQINDLEKALKDVRNANNPTKTTTQKPNTDAYEIANELLAEIKRQRLAQTGPAGELRREAERLFGQYESLLELPTGRTLAKTVGPAELRGFGYTKANLQRVEDLYQKAVGANKSPEAVRELRELTSTSTMQDMAASYLDDVVNKYIRAEKKDFTKLFDEMGFSDKNSLAYEATKELFKDFKNIKFDDLEWFFNALKEFPEVVPNTSQFVMRSAALRASTNLGPAALTGTAGVTAGGPTAALGMGLMYALNRFLAQPFRKDIADRITKGGLNALNKAQKKNVLARFNAFLRENMPNLPTPPEGSMGVIAAQPFVPMLSDVIESQVPMLQERQAVRTGPIYGRPNR